MTRNTARGSSSARKRQAGTGDSYTLICFLVVTAIFACVVIVRDWVKATKDDKVSSREKIEYDRRIKEQHQQVRGIWEK
jgi:hypothetical protein